MGAGYYLYYCGEPPSHHIEMAYLNDIWGKDNHFLLQVPVLQISQTWYQAKGKGLWTDIIIVFDSESLVVERHKIS